MGRLKLKDPGVMVKNPGAMIIMSQSQLINANDLAMRGMLGHRMQMAEGVGRFIIRKTCGPGPVQ